jgi:hypothetical protein
MRKDARPQPQRDELNSLIEEHVAIRRRHHDLDEAILHGKGSPRILDAAGLLVQAMLHHFTHEEQLQKNFPQRLAEAQRLAGMNLMAELLRIEAGLKLAEVYAALRLRGICSRWMRGHLDMEGREFEPTPRPPTPKPNQIQAP